MTHIRQEITFSTCKFVGVFAKFNQTTVADKLPKDNKAKTKNQHKGNRSRQLIESFARLIICVQPI